MRLILLGINHRTAPVALRETLAVTDAALAGVLRAFRQRFAAPAECVVLSTCNRTELYVAQPALPNRASAAGSLQDFPAAEQLRGFLAEQRGVAVEQVTAAAIGREQQAAVHHLFRVTAGLDAMAVGESQVLGQVRRAYDAARRAGTAGPVLHRVFQQALSSARQAQRDSGIDTLRQSVSSMAVEFAGNLFDSLRDKTVVGLGAGEITKTTLRRMLEAGQPPAKMWVVNRTADAGLKLAESLGLSAGSGISASSSVGTSVGTSGGGGGGALRRGGARPWEDLDEALIEADVVLTGTAAAEPVITVERFKPLLRRRRHRPLFLIDLAVPRDVEPGVGALPNVYLYNIDDLNAALAQIPERREKVERCEALVREAATRCMSNIQHQDLGILVRQLRGKLLDIGQDERQRTARKLASLGLNGELAALEQLLDEHTHRVINKILHLPLSQLGPRQRDQSDVSLGFYAAALRRLFDLTEGQGCGGAEDDGEGSGPSKTQGSA